MAYTPVDPVSAPGIPDGGTLVYFDIGGNIHFASNMVTTYSIDDALSTEVEIGDGVDVGKIKLKFNAAGASTDRLMLQTRGAAASVFAGPTLWTEAGYSAPFTNYSNAAYTATGSGATLELTITLP